MTEYTFVELTGAGKVALKCKNLRTAVKAALVHFKLGPEDRALISFRGSRPGGRSRESLINAREREVRRRPRGRGYSSIDPFDKEVLGLD